jgi:hypothetical protein
MQLHLEIGLLERWLNDHEAPKMGPYPVRLVSFQEEEICSHEETKGCACNRRKTVGPCEDTVGICLSASQRELKRNQHTDTFILEIQAPGLVRL